MRQGDALERLKQQQREEEELHSYASSSAEDYIEDVSQRFEDVHIHQNNYETPVSQPVRVTQFLLKEDSPTGVMDFFSPPFMEDMDSKRLDSL